MLYLCIARPRISCSGRASPVSFCPFLPKNRPGEGVTKCFVIFSAGFVVFSKCRIVFSKCFLVSRRQPAVCFRRLKTLKLRVPKAPLFPRRSASGAGDQIRGGDARGYRALAPLITRPYFSRGRTREAARQSKAQKLRSEGCSSLALILPAAKLGGGSAEQSPKTAFSLCSSPAFH